MSRYLIVVVLDGERYSEVGGTPANVPNLVALAHTGVTLSSMYGHTPTETIAGHDALLTGKFEAIPNTGAVSPAYPTFLSEWLYRKGIRSNSIDGFTDRAIMVLSKDKLWCLRKCTGPVQYNDYRPFINAGVNGVGGGGYRADSLTHNLFKTLCLGASPPDISVVGYASADTRAHAHDWAGYNTAIQTLDGYLGEIVSIVNSHPLMAGNTTIIVTTDHGRHLNPNYWDHGGSSESERHAFYVIAGPGILQNVSQPGLQASVNNASTAMYLLMGSDKTYTEGSVMLGIMQPGIGCTTPTPGTGSGTAGSDPDKCVKNLQIRRGLEGPQLILTWDAPNVCPTDSTIRIVRKTYEFSVSPYDGVIVFEGPCGAGSLADLDLDADKCYYYTAFVHEIVPDIWHYNPTSQVAELTIQTGYFTSKLFNSLPNIYILGDKLLGTPNPDQSVYPLYPEFDTLDTEWFNIHENTDTSVEPKKRGPLSRFLKNIAIEPDIVRGLTEAMPTLWDVDETCCANLPALGALIGLDVNTEMPCSKQRQEIKEHVAILKIKGTKAALAARARLISGFRSDVQEWSSNIIIANRLDRTSLKYPNPGLATVFHLPGDDTSYTPGGWISSMRFTIYFELECDECVAQQLVDKLNRVLPSEYPACRVGNMIFLDCRWVECYDSTAIQEIVREIIEEYATEDYRVLRWIFSNRLPNAPELPGPKLDGPFSRNLTNSLFALSASPQRVAIERWWDLLEEAFRDLEDMTNCVIHSNRSNELSNTWRWKTPCAPDQCACYPQETWYDTAQREFEEEVGCWQTHLTVRSNDLEEVSNSLNSLSACCHGPGCDFWYDVEFGLARVNIGRVDLARVNEG